MAEKATSSADITSSTAIATLHVYSIDRLLQLQYSPLVSKPDWMSNLHELFSTLSTHKSNATPAQVKRYMPPNIRKNRNHSANDNLKQKYVTPNHRNENKYEATRKIDFNKKPHSKDSSSENNNGKYHIFNDEEEEEPEWLEPGDTFEMPVATDHSVEEFEKWKAEMKARNSIEDLTTFHVMSQTTALTPMLLSTLESKNGAETSTFSQFFPVSPENNKIDLSLNTKTNDDFFMSLLNKQSSIQNKTMPDSPVSVEDDPVYIDNQKNNRSVRSNSSVFTGNQIISVPGPEYTFISSPPGLFQQHDKLQNDSSVLINSNIDNKNPVLLTSEEQPQQATGFFPRMPPHHQFEGLPHQNPPPPGVYGFPPPIHMHVGPGGPEGPGIGPGFMGYGPLLPSPGNAMRFPMVQPGPPFGFNPHEPPSNMQPQEQKFDGPYPPHQFNRMLPPDMGQPLPMGMPLQGMPHHHPMTGVPLPPPHMQIQGPNNSLGMALPPPGFFEFDLRVDEKTG